MKIYFAGSIRGGRNDSELYVKIIVKLAAYGAVLTEHVSDKTISSYGETHYTNEYIFERDLAWLTEADIVVAEVTTTSLGVGYEIAKAEDLGKPVLCLYREQEGKRLSAMLSGNSKLQVKAYANLDDLDPILKEFFAKL